MRTTGSRIALIVAILVAVIGWGIPAILESLADNNHRFWLPHGWVLHGDDGGAYLMRGGDYKLVGAYFVWARCIAFWYLLFWGMWVVAHIRIGVRQKTKAQRRVELGLCPRCGYDLRASPDGCPECGFARLG